MFKRISTILFLTFWWSVQIINAQDLTVSTNPSSPVGEQKTLVALFYYPDNQLQPITLQDIKNRVLNDPSSIDNFIRENSYGKTWINADFVDWTALPNNSTYYAAKGDADVDLTNDAITVLDSKVNLATYTRFVFIFNDNYNSLGFPGTTTFQSFPISSPTKGTFNATVSLNSASGSVDDIGVHNPRMTHEYAHQLGFMHAGDIDCGNDPYNLPKSLLDPAEPKDSCNGGYAAYGDPIDVMGAAAGQLSSVWKSQAGWIESTQIQDAASTGVYTLDQLELPSSGIKTIRIPLGKDIDNTDVYYWLEYRRQLGTFDNFQGRNVPDPVYIRVQTMGAIDQFQQWLAKNTLMFSDASGLDNHEIDVNKPFFDPYRGIKVEMIDKTGTDADSKTNLKISLSGVSTTPQYALNFGTVAPNSTYNNSVKVANNSTQAFTIGTLAIGGRHASLFTIATDGCSTKILQPSESCNVDISFAPIINGKTFAVLSVPTSDATRPLATMGIYGEVMLSQNPYVLTVSSVGMGGENFFEAVPNNMKYTGILGDGTVYKGSYNPGTTVTLNAYSTSDRIFVGWSGDCIGASGSQSVTLNSNKSCIATYNAIPSGSYAVFLESGSGGVISPDSAQIVSKGATATFTFTPNAGNKISSITGCGGTLSGTTYITGAITGACTVSASFSIVDVTAPVVSALATTVTATSLTVPTVFSATDNVAVTGYLLTETSTKPSPTATGWTATGPIAGWSGWSPTAPTSYTFTTAGSKTLYAWAKDANGNVSSSVSAGVTITLPATTLKGDVNGDGKVDIMDALLTLQYALNLIPHNSVNDAIYLGAADVAPVDTVTLKPKGDGKIDVMDALVILQRSVGLLSW